MKYLIIALLVFFCLRADAQSCTASLGDPIVDIDFGSGQGFGAPLAAGITNMTYIQDQCPEDGSYTIVSQTTGCFGSWLNVTSDHTGNPNGRFMLINASYDPSDFYVQTINGLCAGTTYQFAAWILNMVSVQGQILPNITFTIEQTDGTVLQTYKTGDIPSPGSVKWTQYGFFFNTPVGVNTVVIRMTNNQTGGIGNDLALDDITFRAAGPAITVLGSSGFVDDSLSLCQTDPRPIQFGAIVENCYANPVYQWQLSTDGESTWSAIPGATDVNYLRAPTGPGSYNYRLTVAQAGNIGISSCTVASDPATVIIVGTPSPQVSIVADVDSICAGSPATFTASSTDGGNSPAYQWMVDGVAAGTDQATYVNSSLTSNDIVSCVMMSNATCVVNPVAVSNNLSVTVIPNTVASVTLAGSANGICQDSVVIFTATPYNGGSFPSYQWTVNGVNTGSDSAVFSDGRLNNGDIINCLMTSSIDCSLPVSATQPITMIVYPLPVIDLITDTVIAGGHSLRLDPLVTGNIVSYQWSPTDYLDNPASPNPLATPPGTMTYSLRVTTTDGCSATAHETVGVFYSVLMPGAFSPNGDGRNDLFRVPPLVPITIRRLAVFNRQGVMVYSTSNATSEGWDGTFNGHPQPAGVYVWEMDYNNPLTKRAESVKGTVVLVR